MTIVFVSNFLNHHQLPFCQEMLRKDNVQFTFVATEPISQERLDMGYADMNHAYPFVIRAYDGRETAILARERIDTADIVILGSAPEMAVQTRLAQDKLTFYYSERLYKEGYIYLFAPKRRKKICRNHLAFRDKPLYMLCASSFTAGDFALNGAYKGKCFRWGYFPHVYEYDVEELLRAKQRRGKVMLLWVGRMLRLKHPEQAIALARRLDKEGYDFTLRMIGAGPMERELRRLVQRCGVEKRVELLGVMPPEEVRRQMEQADIFLFTSDYQEGWGAVLNEAMNSACAVVCSDAVGSAGFLIDTGRNGLLYRNGKTADLYKKTVSLLKDASLRQRLGREAYRTMLHDWSPHVAAQRLVELGRALGKGESTPFSTGPCSIAPRRYGGFIYQKREKR